MGALFGIISIIIYYIVISKYIDGGTSPALLVGVAYILIPLIIIPLIAGAVMSGLKPELKNRNLKGFILTISSLSVVIALTLVANRFFAPTRPDPAAEELSRQSNWIIRGQEVIKTKLKDPNSAEFRNVYFNRSKDGMPVTCGEVNSKNSFGGYSGYQKFISAGSHSLSYLQEEFSQNDFAFLWNNLCVKIQK